MNRPPNPEIKADLLQRAAAYVLRHGLTDLSLRPLAAELGTNARMLLYHFGSKEELIVQVLTALGQQQQALLAATLTEGASPAERFGQLWALLTSPELTPFMRSLFEVELRAIDGEVLYQQFARELLQGWMGLVQVNLKTEALPVANFVMAALTGLLLDRFSTGDLERTDSAFGALVGALRKGDLL